MNGYSFEVTQTEHTPCMHTPWPRSEVGQMSRRTRFVTHFSRRPSKQQKQYARSVCTEVMFAQNCKILKNQHLIQSIAGMEIYTKDVSSSYSAFRTHVRSLSGLMGF